MVMDIKIELNEEEKSTLRKVFNADDTITDGELLAMAQERTLFPRLHNNKFSFLDKTIEMRPLPISKSKEINKAFQSSQKIMTTLMGKAGSAVKPDGKIDQGKIMEIYAASDVGMDITLADSILNCVKILSDFYNLSFTVEDIDNKCNLPTAIDFLETQFIIQGENDFLLRPLVDTLRSMKESSKVKGQTLSLFPNM